MATQRVLNKLDSLVGVTDLTNAELKFVITNWDDAAKRLQSQVVRCFKDMPKIPAALQVLFIETDERAARAIGDLLCEEAQDLILGDKVFADDVAVLVSKCTVLPRIAESLWRRLAMLAKRGELKPITIRKLSARKDVHPNFLKAVGVTTTVAAKEQVRARVTGKVSATKARKPRVDATDTDFDDDEPVVKKAAAKPASKPASKSKAVAAVRGVFKPVRKTVNTAKASDLDDDDFAEPKKIGKIVRKVRRPQL